MDAPQEIKSKIDVVDLVSEYLPLKPSGTGSFKALCPFHQEKTPSFYASRPRQSWHCFGCDEGGDVFTFIEKIEGMDFREALEHLAAKAGVELPKYQGGGQDRSLKQRLQEINLLAAKYFQQMLQSSEDAEKARSYVSSRGLDELTSDLFLLGFSADSWDKLTQALLKQGVTSQELLLAGLVAKSEKRDGVYDRFRGRLMFPINDVHGNIIGFTARILTDAKEAKYINTPETSLYKKSAVVYGLDKAKGEIRQQDLAVIVEGNMDVITSHQFGVSNVVATSGTALTNEQLNLLKRYTKNLAIAFDQDSAGVQATLRGLDLARKQDFNIRIISLPPDAGKDPDEAIRKDVELWKAAIKNAEPIMDWIYATAFRSHSSARPEGKKEIAKTVLDEIRQIGSPIVQDHWLKKLAKDLEVGEASVREAFGKNVAKKPQSAYRKVDETEASTKSVQHESERDDSLFAIMLADEDVFQKAVASGLEPEDFISPVCRSLYRSMREAYNGAEFSNTPRDPSGKIIHPPETLEPDEVKAFNRLVLLAEHSYQGISKKELLSQFEQGLANLRRHKMTTLRQRLEQEMREAERSGDSKKIEEILKQVEQLRSP